MIAKVYLHLLLLVIKTEIDKRESYTLLSKSSPQKQLFAYKHSVRFFDIKNTPQENESQKIAHKIQFIIGKSGNSLYEDVRIKFSDINMYLCWKKLNATDGVIVCDDDNSEKTKWILQKTDENDEYKITNGDFCLTLGSSDDKIKHSYYAKTERCDDARESEQRFLAHLLLKAEEKKVPESRKSEIPEEQVINPSDDRPERLDEPPAIDELSSPIDSPLENANPEINKDDSIKELLLKIADNTSKIRENEKLIPKEPLRNEEVLSSNNPKPEDESASLKNSNYIKDLLSEIAGNTAQAREQQRPGPENYQPNEIPPSNSNNVPRDDIASLKNDESIKDLIAKIAENTSQPRDTNRPSPNDYQASPINQPPRNAPREINRPSPDIDRFGKAPNSESRGDVPQPSDSKRQDPRDYQSDNSIPYFRPETSKKTNLYMNDYEKAPLPATENDVTQPINSGRQTSSDYQPDNFTLDNNSGRSKNSSPSIDKSDKILLPGAASVNDKIGNTNNRFAELAKKLEEKVEEKGHGVKNSRCLIAK